MGQNQSGQLGSYVSAGGFSGGQSQGGVQTPTGGPLTQGQVVYPDVNGKVTGDANFFYDPTNIRMSVGFGSGVSAGLNIGSYGQFLSGYGAIWATNVVPSSTNFSFATNGTQTTINGANAVSFAVGAGVIKWNVTSGSLAPQTNNGSTLGTASLRASSVFTSAFNVASGIVAGNFLVSTNNCVVRSDASGGATIVTLPAAATANGQLVVIKKSDSSANTVTVQANAAELIDGSNTRVLTAQYQSVMLIANNLGWDIV